MFFLHIHFLSPLPASPLLRCIVSEKAQDEMGSRRVCRPFWVLFSTSQNHGRGQGLRERQRPGGHPRESRPPTRLERGFSQASAQGRKEHCGALLGAVQEEGLCSEEGTKLQVDSS